MSRNLPSKVEAGLKAVDRKTLERLIQNKALTLYDLLNMGYGTYFEELIDKLREWDSKEEKFYDFIGVHREVIVYTTQLGMNTFKASDLEQFVNYYERIRVQNRIYLKEEEKRELEEEINKININIRSIQTDHNFESDREQRLEISQRYINEYLKENGGEHNLSLDLVDENIKGFKEMEVLNGKYYLLLILKDATQKKIRIVDSEIPGLEKELESLKGPLSKEEAKKFDDFINNLDQTYSPASYHAKFSEHKADNLAKRLIDLKPLP